MDTPTPSWKPGDPITAPSFETIAIDPAAQSSGAIYKVMISAIVPRPIALVSTRSASGVNNLAPFSFFNGVSSNPPCLSIAITRKSDGSKKDTLRNIEETGQFVVSLAAEWIIGPVNQTSAEYDYGVDEFQKVGLTAIPSIKVKPSRVQESPVHFECELYKSVEVGDGGVGSSTLVIGRIVMIHASTAAYVGGKLKLDELRPISRLGGISYGRTAGVFDLNRPEIL